MSLSFPYQFNLETKKEKLECAEQNAHNMMEWLRTRGGLAVWRSVDLSDPSASWTTPVNDKDGKPFTKPTWKAESQPSRIITDAADVVVTTDKVVERFHVATRVGRNGLMVKLTDASSAKLRKKMDKHGNTACYHFDYGEYDNAVITVLDTTVPLIEWIEKHPKQNANT